jgi:hypothetical protein
MVRQRQEMHERSSQMQAKMMSHMAGHMSSSDGMQRMTSCPMMQGQQPSQQQDPQEHHPVE